MKSDINIEYGIIELQEESYKFNYDIDLSQLDKAKLEFQFEHNISVSTQPEGVIITMRVHLMYNAEEAILQGVRAVFAVKPFHNFVNEIQEDGFEVTNPSLIDTFISVCIGAIRGMLAKNLKGTPIESVVLPLVPMKVISANSTKKRK